MDKKDTNLMTPYMASVHKAGRAWGLALFTVILAFPFLICVIFQASPEWGPLWKGILATLPMYWAVGVIEMITYVPMLGSGGSYLAFVTGNISNLKLPCALDAMEKAGVKASSEEGELISTISIAVSSIVTTVIIIIGVCLIIPITPLLQNEYAKMAFDQILPALFGGLAVVFVSKNWKLALGPIILMLILFIAVPALNAGTVGIMVPVGVVVTVIIARILYVKGVFGKPENKKAEEAAKVEENTEEAPVAEEALVTEEVAVEEIASVDSEEK